MAAKIVVGASDLANEQKAAAEAVEIALQGGDRPVFALVLATSQYDSDQLAAAVTRALGDVPWAGCCAAGVFAGKRLLQQGLVVGAVSAPAARVGVGVAQPVSRDGRRAGELATARALEGFPPSAPPGWSRAVIVLPDAFTGNVADVVRGSMEMAGTGVVWAGGGTGDNLRPGASAQFAGGRAHLDSVVVVAIDSPARMACGISHGFRPYGPATMVTRAEGSTRVSIWLRVSKYTAAPDSDGKKSGVTSRTRIDVATIS